MLAIRVTLDTDRLITEYVSYYILREDKNDSVFVEITGGLNKMKLRDSESAIF